MDKELARAAERGQWNERKYDQNNHAWMQRKDGAGYQRDDRG